MNFFTRISMKNAAVVILAALMIIGGGIYSARQMKSESMPDIEVPVIYMTAIYPGAGPNDVSKEITEPMEKALQGIGGVKNVTSYSSQNAGTIVLEFDFSADLDKAQQDINSALAKVQLPDSVKKPELHRASVNDPNIMSYSLSSNGKQAEAAQFVKNVIKPSLSNIEGVEDITLDGESSKKIFVRLLPDKLKEYSITLDSVKQALQGANISIPAGEVTMTDKLMPIEVKKEIKSVDDLKNMSLFTIDQSSGVKNAMNAVGGGFQDIGKAMEQGFAKMGEAQKGQMQILGNIQLLSLAVAGEQQQLNSLTAPFKDGTKTPDAATQAQIDALIKDIATKNGILNQLTQQLQGILASLDKMSSSSAAASGNKTAPAANNNVSMTPAVKTLTLGDIAEVSYGYAKESSLVRTNGKEGVVFSVSRQSGGNVVDISQKVEDKLKKFTLPKGYQLEKLFDYAIPIKKSVDSMLREGLLGALFAVLVTFIFLRNIRATLVSIISIPLSILAALIVISKLGYTINTMTLSGMAVAVGRVVDDSIVVIENIYRRLRSAEVKDARLVYEATTEVSGAITSSTLTTIAVFGPLAFVSGIIGKIFVPFAVTVVVALAFSLIVATTVVPLMSRLFLLKIQPKEEKEGRIRAFYGNVLTWSLNHKAVVIIIALSLLGGSIALVPVIGTNFLPQDVVRYYRVNVTMPVGSSLEKTDNIARQVESIAKGEKDVAIYQASVGSDGKTSIFISIKDSVKDPKIAATDIRKKIKGISGANDISMQELGSPAGAPMLQIQVNGNNFEDIKKAGKQISDTLKPIKGLTDVTSNIEDTKPQIVIQVDEKKATAKGLNPLMVGGLLREMITGSKVTSMTIDGQDADLEVSFKTDDLSSIDKIKDLELMTTTGEKVKVSEVADVAEKPGPTSIQRKNMTQFASVSGLITASNSGDVSKAAEEKVNKLKLPQGVTWSMEGNTKMMSEGFRDMGIAMGIAVVLVFIVMIAAFGGAMAPFSILFSLPLALIGALIALLLSGEQVGMPSLIGGLMLIGIVVTNAIVLVDRVQQQRKKGLAVREALVEAGKTRIRPIFMTAIATVGALIPMAVMPAEGALVSKSMAIVVIGGLTTSTLLTLIIVPVIYNIFDNIMVKIFKLDTRAELNI